MADLVAQYLDLVIVNGATPDDPRLNALLPLMTPEEVEFAKQRLCAEYVRTLPAPTGSGAPTPPELGFVDLYVEIVRRRGRPDDPRLAAMLDAMSPDELRRGRRAIGELWLAQLTTGPPN